MEGPAPDGGVLPFYGFMAAENAAAADDDDAADSLTTPRRSTLKHFMRLKEMKTKKKKK